MPKGPKKLGRCSAGRVSYSSFLPLLPLLTPLCRCERSRGAGTGLGAGAGQPRPPAARLCPGGARRVCQAAGQDLPASLPPRLAPGLDVLLLGACAQHGLPPPLFPAGLRHTALRNLGPGSVSCCCVPCPLPAPCPAFLSRPWLAFRAFSFPPPGLCRPFWLRGVLPSRGGRRGWWPPLVPWAPFPLQHPFPGAAAGPCGGWRWREGREVPWQLSIPIPCRVCSVLLPPADMRQMDGGWRCGRGGPARFSSRQRVPPAVPSAPWRGAEPREPAPRAAPRAAPCQLLSELGVPPRGAGATDTLRPDRLRCPRWSRARPAAARAAPSSPACPQRATDQISNSLRKKKSVFFWFY